MAEAWGVLQLATRGDLSMFVASTLSIFGVVTISPDKDGAHICTAKA